MRVFGGACSRMVFGCLTGLTVAIQGASAQEAEPAAAAEPLAIEIIGEPSAAMAPDPAKSAPEATASPADEPAAGDLAPTAAEPLATTAAASSSSGVGTENAAPREKVDPFIGSFSTAVPIEVPAFHGIEPNLALTYNSSRGNGFVGVGWELSGLSVIERASPGKGAPRYDSTDIYLLDGQELIPCTAGTVSPSCGTGGTHATKVESNLRITQDSTGNIWEIQGRDGTKTTYTAVMGPNILTETGSYRWAMTAVADTHGNTVTYTWWCDGTPAVECYPDTVTYNETTVRLYRELRNDTWTFATGLGLGQTSYRLKSVDVLVGADRRRAYELDYVTSNATSRSRLANITSYGKDATLDGTGTVLSGTSLPATSLTYLSDGSPSAFGTSNTTGMYLSSTDARNWTGDFNGDGRTDIVAMSGDGDGTASVYANFSIEGGFTTTSFNNLSLSSDSSRNRIGDFNGDGKADILKIISASGGTSSVKVNYSNSNGFDVLLHENLYLNTSLPWTFLGDFDGDGKTDLFSPSWSGNTVVGVHVNYSTGTGFNSV